MHDGNYTVGELGSVSPETLTVDSREGYHRSDMLILSTDTSTSYYSVALCDDDHVLAELSVDGGRRHSERLIDSVDWLLQQTHLKLGDIDMLAVAQGPGSFTGLRVGVSTWKGLALGAGLPLVGVSTLDATASLCAVSDGLVCTLLDAKMAEVFGAIYLFEGGRRRTTLPERVCPVEDILAKIEGDVLFVGDGAEVYRNRIEDALHSATFAHGACRFPRASAVAAEARRALDEGAASDPAHVRPVYLRKSQAEEARLEASEKVSAP